MIILEGGKINCFVEKEEILKEIKINCSTENTIDLLIESNTGTGSLTYLSLQEALFLKRNLQKAIEELINK